ncbi:MULTISPECIES: Sec-independent protein translocase protein TatB [unclassified Halomonas]|uniref:Sec-independent protein translocase protein TatB n=1 Tax=unclassified Halomonas TaxID=2609666 RepID=UPI0020A1784F|nr:MULTISPECIES: Sec-independent protein translocase protein TatB [unclassified Halomonas]MCP1313611.1 Sec-independent protein translocase protein TatB [Halomonas sp. 707D7]MCP1325404.1 Sec-independent protein translocase protein TatB [Halomonas sp. 707D4]
MLDIGFLELMLIGIVALVVLGPERLPKAARTTGMWIGKIKRTVSGMQREITAQLEAEELRQKLSDQQKKLDESLSQAKRDVERIADVTRVTSRPGGNSAQADKYVEEARTHLDDALKTVHEEPVVSPAPATDAPADTDPKKADPRKADPKKDSTSP